MRLFGSTVTEEISLFIGGFEDSDSKGVKEDRRKNKGDNGDTMMIELLIITALIVFIVDLSGIIESMESGLGKWLKCTVRIPKPFSCSLCMSWWTGLIYLICVGQFSILWIGYVGLLAFLTPVINNLLQLLRDGLNKIINWLYDTLITE